MPVACWTRLSRSPGFRILYLSQPLQHLTPLTETMLTPDPSQGPCSWHNWLSPRPITSATTVGTYGRYYNFCIALSQEARARHCCLNTKPRNTDSTRMSPYEVETWVSATGIALAQNTIPPTYSNHHSRSWNPPVTPVPYIPYKLPYDGSFHFTFCCLFHLILHYSPISTLILLEWVAPPPLNLLQTRPVPEQAQQPQRLTGLEGGCPGRHPRHQDGRAFCLVWGKRGGTASRGIWI